MNKLENIIPASITLFCVAFLVWGLIPQRGSQASFESGEFGRLPVLLNGRLKPIDTVARNALLIIHGKQTFKFEDEGKKRKMRAVEWLLEVVYDAPTANSRKVFLIHNQDVLSLIGAKKEDGKLYSYTELAEHADEILQQAIDADAIEAQLQTAFQRHTLKLQRQLTLYQKLQHSLQHPGATNVAGELREFMDVVEPGIEASNLKESGEPYDEETFSTMTRLASKFITQAGHAYFIPVPPSDRSPGVHGWRKIGDAAMMAADEGSFPHAVTAYADMGDAFRIRDSSAFAESANGYSGWMQANHESTADKASYEAFFNAFSPFYKSMVYYVLAFLLACFFWLSGSDRVRRAAMVPLFFALSIHVFGLVSRMAIEGRPPVTNLYSSAVFVGLGAVVLGSVLELIHRNGIGTATASMTGFVTLLIAHHLSGDGDTMEMMRAVLDSNFWLATHVVVITLGYASTFLAGALALIYVLRKFIFGQLDQATGKTMAGMVYGIVCFSTLFSFVGTILGGIWADQSWGRFWGWDPKENGALLIVLWNAIILHARWGGMVRERGLMVLAIFGNIVTSWSWFGTNMLGIGLHSYGFTEATFLWLLFFIVTQLAFMAVGIRGRAFRVPRSSTES